MSGILLNYHKIPVIAILVIPVYWAEFYKNFQCCPERRDLHYPLFPPIISPSMLKLTGQQTNWNANRGSCCPVGSLKTATQSNRNMSEIAQKKRQRSAWRKISLYYWLQVASYRSKQLPHALQLQRLETELCQFWCKEWLCYHKKGGQSTETTFHFSHGSRSYSLRQKKVLQSKDWGGGDFLSLKESSLIDLSVVRFIDIEHKCEKQKHCCL